MLALFLKLVLKIFWLNRVSAILSLDTCSVRTHYFNLLVKNKLRLASGLRITTYQ